jgi:phosphoribosylformylglycinamidine cyclo-ligase
MPGLYQEGEYDLAGFAVGIVNRDRLIDGSAIEDGDAVIGLASSGLHSNGFSLVRKLIGDAGIALDAPAPFGDKTLGNELLTPTRIYSPTALALSHEFPMHGLAHITGGGLTENVPRILHGHWDVELDLESWQAPQVFSWLARLGDLSDDDLFRTFNMGVGFVVVVPPAAADETIARANELGERAIKIGVVRPGAGRVLRRGSWRDSRP